MSQDSVPMLRSYTGGAWRTGSGEGVPLHDAVTGEPVARVSSAGIDMAGALDYGRRVGGPALRELTFHQRAALLKALASHLREHREELYALSARAGATRYDAKFDVDGGIAVLTAYASKGRCELPNDTVYVDGGLEPLSKGGTFAGQHIATPLRGVAIQINAFNFPVWGPLEKLAPAFLAGVPSLIKPASQTAYLTEKLAELIVSAGLLPAGNWVPGAPRAEGGHPFRKSLRELRTGDTVVAGPRAVTRADGRADRPARGAHRGHGLPAGRTAERGAGRPGGDVVTAGGAGRPGGDVGTAW